MAGRRRSVVDVPHGNRAPEDTGHDYVVMGDLGVGATGDSAALSRKQVRDGTRKYVVRMFLGGIHEGADAHDEEFVAHIEDLHDAVTSRMEELAKKPDPRRRVPIAETDDHLTKTRQHPGHAVGVPGHWLSEERGQYEAIPLGGET